MSNIEQAMNSLITNYSSDYTVESITSSLIKKGVLPNQIILKATGTLSRSNKKDVSNIYSRFDEETNNILYFLESPREGIYDTLPESIFHSFSGKQTAKNKFEVIEEIKRHREEEKQARNFFLPFEQEFFTIRNTIFSFEDQFEWMSTTSSLIEIYRTCYPILNDLPAEKGYLFLRLIPLIHEIRDDFKRIERCLAMLLDATVQINLSFRKNTVTSYTPPELGFATLGTDTIIGDCMEDGEPDLSIILSPTPLSKAQDYLFFKKIIQRAEHLCAFFIGAQYDVSIAYALDVDAHYLALDESSVLGYNVYL